MIGDRWGVSDAEVLQRYPCDDLLLNPAAELWRGITVFAPIGDAWQWIKQIRIAPYSYDWLDNLGRRSPQSLLALPEPVPGEKFSTSALGPVGRIQSMESRHQITGVVMGCPMSYVLVEESGAIRILLKILIPSWYGPFSRLLSVGDLIMARRQLTNLKRLIEGR